jgi:hypothetical protein
LPDASLTAWEHARLLKDLPLPSGMVVDFEVPDLWTYALYGTIPNPLAAMAMQVESKQGLDPMELDADAQRQYADLVYWTIATHLRKPNLVAGLGSEEAAITFVRDKMLPDDRGALWAKAVHLITQEDIARGVVDLVEGSEELRTVMDLQSFRGGASSDNGAQGNRNDRRARERAAWRAMRVLRMGVGRSD